MDPWSHTRKPKRYAKRLAEEMQCRDTDNSAAILKCLREVPAKVISVRQLAKNLTVKFYEDPIAGFGPTVEPIVGDGSNTFLSTSPYELLVSGNFSKVPILTGEVPEDGIYLWAACEQSKQ